MDTSVTSPAAPVAEGASSAPPPGPPVPPTLAVQFKPVIDAAEAKKKEGDIHFARLQFHEAVDTYTAAAALLNPIRFLPAAETCAARIFSNHIQSLIKLNLKDKALAMCEFARTIPSMGNDTHLQRKLYSRRASLLEDLGNIPSALHSIDHAISLDPTLTDLDASRERLISILTEQSVSTFSPPSRPGVVTPEMVTAAITIILKCHGDSTCETAIRSIIDLPGYIDKRDAKGNNLMWAICQAAMIRSSLKEEKADEVLPMLQLLLQNGAMAEQRYPSSEQQNKTPLMMVSVSGAVECARLLLKYRASPLSCDDSGWNALTVACSPKHPRFESPDDPDSGSNDAMIELFIESGAPVNYRMLTNGMSPLSLCAQGLDHHSINQLIIGGATLNIRDAQQFSPIVWALIGSRGIENNETVRTIIQAAKDIDENIFEEVMEDMRCFRLGRLILTLKQALNAFLRSHAPPNANKAEPPPNVPAHLIHGHIGLGLCILSNSIPNTSKSVTETDQNVAEVVHKWIQDYIPASLFKQWTPVENPQEALQNGSATERAHLLIMMTAATGPLKNEPLFSRDSKSTFMTCARFPDYRLLMIEPLLTLFSTYVVTDSIIQVIKARTPLLHVFSRGTDYWVKHLRLSGIDVTTLRRNTIQEVVDGPAVAAPQIVFNFVKDDESIVNYEDYDFETSKDKTLFIVWNIAAGDRLHMLQRFVGSTVILLGYLELEHESNVYFESNFERQESIEVASWLPHSSTLSVWKRK